MNSMHVNNSGIESAHYNERDNHYTENSHEHEPIQVGTEENLEIPVYVTKDNNADAPLGISLTDFLMSEGGEGGEGGEGSEPNKFSFSYAVSGETYNATVHYDKTYETYVITIENENGIIEIEGEIDQHGNLVFSDLPGLPGRQIKLVDVSKEVALLNFYDSDPYSGQTKKSKNNQNVPSPYADNGNLGIVELKASWHPDDKMSRQDLKIIRKAFGVDKNTETEDIRKLVEAGIIEIVTDKNGKPKIRFTEHGKTIFDSFKTIDENGDGVVSFDEWSNSLKGFLSEDLIKNDFENYIDRNKDNNMSLAEFSAFLKDLDDGITSYFETFDARDHVIENTEPDNDQTYLWLLNSFFDPDSSQIFEENKNIAANFKYGFDAYFNYPNANFNYPNANFISLLGDGEVTLDQITLEQWESFWNSPITEEEKALWQSNTNFNEIFGAETTPTRRELYQAFKEGYLKELVENSYTPEEPSSSNTTDREYFEFLADNYGNNDGKLTDIELDQLVELNILSKNDENSEYEYELTQHGQNVVDRFKEFDQNGDGSFQLDEYINQVLEESGIKEESPEYQYYKNIVTAFFNDFMDTDNSGNVTFGEYARFKNDFDDLDTMFFMASNRTNHEDFVSSFNQSISRLEWVFVHHKPDDVNGDNEISGEDAILTQYTFDLLGYDYIKSFQAIDADGDLEITEEEWNTFWDADLTKEEKEHIICNPDYTMEQLDNMSRRDFFNLVQNSGGYPVS